MYSVSLDSNAHDETDKDVSMSVAGMGDDPDHGHDPAHNKADADVSIGKTGVDDDLDSVMTMMMKAETSSKNQNCFLCLLTWK